jgi:hypothetical protein
MSMSMSMFNDYVRYSDEYQTARRYAFCWTLLFLGLETIALFAVNRKVPSWVLWTFLVSSLVYLPINCLFAHIYYHRFLRRVGVTHIGAPAVVDA